MEGRHHRRPQRSSAVRAPRLQCQPCRAADPHLSSFSLSFVVLPQPPPLTHHRSPDFKQRKIKTKENEKDPGQSVTTPPFTRWLLCLLSEWRADALVGHSGTSESMSGDWRLLFESPSDPYRTSKMTRKDCRFHWVLCRTLWAKFDLNQLSQFRKPMPLAIPHE